MALKEEFKKLLNDTIRAAEQYGRVKENKGCGNSYILGALSILKWNKRRLNTFVNRNFLIKRKK